MQRSSLSLVVGLVLISIANVLLCGRLINFSFTSPVPAGFYGFQTDALLAGQLHLKVAPHPQLAKQANPYAGEQNRDFRILDLSYYKGRYYSYFGIGPALVLTIPYRLLTDRFLTEPGATVILAWLTAFAALWALQQLTRRCFPDLGTTEILCAYAFVTLGNYSTLLMIGTNPGTVAQYGGYLFITLAIAALARDDVAYRGWRNLVFASFCLAMALACRPSFLPAAALLIPSFFFRWLSRPTAGRLFRLALFTALPFFLIISGLLIYNFLRFDQFLEFGNRLQLTGQDYRHVPLFTRAALLEHAAQFVTTPFEYQHYFPFLLTRHDFAPIGLFYLCPAGWMVLGVLAAYWPKATVTRQGRVISVGVMIAFLGVFTILASYILFLFHYEIDFIVLWNWVVVLGWFCLLSTMQGLPRRSIRLLGSISCIATVALASMYTVSVADPNVLCPRLARAVNGLVDRADQLKGIEYGPITMQVNFPAESHSRYLPLVTTGHDHNDLIYAEVTEGKVRFGYFHAGLGGPLGEYVEFNPSRTYTLEVHLGSLLPPETHPYFSGWTPSSVLRAKSNLEVKLEGNTVLFGSVDYYPSSPADVLTGENSVLRDISESKFPGRIVEVKRRSLGQTKPAAWPEIRTGAVEIDLKLSPTQHSVRGEPLLSTGVSGRGDLVFIKYLPNSMVSFGLDHWGQAFQSKPESLNPSSTHTLKIVSDALSDTPSKDGRFQLYLDNRPTLIVPVSTFPSEPDQVFYGINAIHSSVSSPMFSGTISAVRSAPWEKSTRRSVERAGVITLSVLLQYKKFAVGQPLLVSGEAGKADVVFLRLIDESHLVVGIDHWGVGGPVSSPITFEPTTPHRIELKLGGILALDPNFKGSPDDFVISVDGNPVLQGKSQFFPVSLSTIFIGENPAGGSTATAVFEGEILEVTTSP